jgi:molybdate transport system substrate-binding protein
LSFMPGVSLAGMRRDWLLFESQLAPLRSSLFLLTAALLLPAFAAAQAPLRVAAAADLEPVLPPIVAQFEQQTGLRAEATYQASAMLTTQIENGAPFDLFLSADLGFPQRLIDEHKADAGPSDSSAPITYARGTLVLWARNPGAPADRSSSAGWKDSHLPPPSLALLSDPNLKRLAIANPDRAPYGRAAVAALHSLHLYDALKPRLVTAENIAQAAQFVDSGNADAGLISLTSALTPRLASTGRYFVLPPDLYPPIEQGAVIVSATHQHAAAQRFLEFLLSPAVQAELQKSGLTPVK